MHGNRSADRPVSYPADLYDAFTRLGLDYYDRWFLLRFSQLYPARRRRPVLDVGVGTGQLLLRLAAVKGAEGCHFVGLDAFAEMVELAAANVRAANSGSTPISIVRSDAHSLPFADGAFGLVTSRSTLHHFRSPDVAVSEMYRVTGTGGVVLIHDVRRDASPEVVAQFNALRQRFGVPPTNLEEKLSMPEVESLTRRLGLMDCTRIFSPRSGLGSLGYELLLHRR